MLKAKVDKLEDVPESDRKHYKKVDLADGKVEYLADIEKVGGLELQDATGLVATLEKLRQHERTVGQYGTITPAEAGANLKKIGELNQQLEDLKKGGKGGDEERIKQVRDELARAHTAEMTPLKARAESRLAEVVRLRRDEASEAALKEAGFKSALRLMKPVLAAELDVLEDEKTGAFRTVVRGPGGVERIYVDPKTTQDRPMSALERAREMAQDPELRGYRDVETVDDKGDKGGAKKTTKVATTQFGSRDRKNDQDIEMSPIEMLVAARAGK